MQIDLSRYSSGPIAYQPVKWPTPNFITDIDEFNNCLEWAHEIDHELELTPNGWLAKKGILREGWFDENQRTNSFGVAVIRDGHMWRFVFRPGYEERPDDITGMYALKKFRENCGRIAKPYEMTRNEDIEKVKQTIEKPLIRMNGVGRFLLGEELYNVWHIDIHSAYPGMICKMHPEFYDYFNGLYETRKTHPENKSILNLSIGAMQSTKMIGRRYPELSRDAINGTREFILDMTDKLRAAGLEVIAYNTDGIFVRGTAEYHDENEGSAMGQWSVDHKFDKIRFKSAGAYEYIENGEYHAVVRGIPRKLSKTFVWGDIFKHHPKKLIMLDNKVQEVEITDEEAITLYN